MPKKKVKRQGSTRSTSSGREGKSIYRRILILYLVFAALFVSLPIISRLFSPTCANSISCIKDLSGEFEQDQEGTFLGKKITVPSYLSFIPSEKRVLGKTSGPKHISVDLTRQRLYAHEGDKQVFEFPVSTGKWGRTPTGEYKIWVKLRYTRMSGGSGNDYYNLPNVPYVMFFYNNEISKARGYSLHGAYWHNNFGYPMSHGCINMRPRDAAELYEWADPPTTAKVTHSTNESPGTTITIYGEPPS